MIHNKVSDPSVRITKDGGKKVSTIEEMSVCVSSYSDEPERLCPEEHEEGSFHWELHRAREIPSDLKKMQWEVPFVDDSSPSSSTHASRIIIDDGKKKVSSLHHSSSARNLWKTSGGKHAVYGGGKKKRKKKKKKEKPYPLHRLEKSAQLPRNRSERRRQQRSKSEKKPRKTISSSKKRSEKKKKSKQTVPDTTERKRSAPTMATPDRGPKYVPRTGSHPILSYKGSSNIQEKGKKTSPREFLLVSPRHRPGKLLDRFKRFGSPSPPKRAPPAAITAEKPLSESSKTFESSSSSSDISLIYAEILETKRDGGFHRWMKRTLDEFGVGKDEMKPEKRAFLVEIYDNYGPETAYSMMEKFYPNKIIRKSGLRRSPSITQLELDRHESERATVSPNGKFLTGPLLRISSEERLVRASACGDQVLSPREVEDWRAKLIERKRTPSPNPLSGASSSSIEDEFWENLPAAPSRRATICVDPHLSEPLSPSEASAVKLFRLLVCNEHQGEFSRRMNQARGKGGRHCRSTSVEKDRIIRKTNEKERSHSMDRGSSNSSNPCLESEPRYSKEKKVSEERLCRLVMLSISGGTYTDEYGRTIYRDIKGIRVSEDEAIVLGAFQCTFTGHRMVLKNIHECQVLGSECEVEGDDNFIRGRKCSVIGFENVIHGG